MGRIRCLSLALTAVGALVGLQLAGCSAMLAMLQHRAEGENPLRGTPLTLSWAPGLADGPRLVSGGVCPMERPLDSLMITATPEVICLDELAHRISASEQPGPAPLPFDEAIGSRRLEIDGEVVATVEMAVVGYPEQVMDCPGSPGGPQPYQRMFRYRAKGCVPNRGVLTLEARTLGLRRRDALAAFAVFSLRSPGG